MYRNHSVGVVVPAYNEEGFVGEVIDTMPAYVDRVYAVDDQSTDGTWDEILDRADFGGQQPEPLTDGGATGTAGRPGAGGSPQALTPTGPGSTLVPIRHEVNLGVGGAIKTGYQRAVDDGMDLVAVMAGDGQMDPDQLDRLLDPLVDDVADYAKANRLRSADHRAGMSSFRLFGNALLTLLTKISSGYWELLDPQNGYTVITREALETVDLEEAYDGYGFANDLLARLNRHELRVAHVDIPANYGDETSHISYGSFVRSVSLLLLSNFLWRLKHKYVLGSFHPLVLSYAVGATVSLVGLLAVLGTLVGLVVGLNGGLAVGVSALVMVVGADVLLSAMREEATLHEGLEVQVT